MRLIGDVGPNPVSLVLGQNIELCSRELVQQIMMDDNDQMLRIAISSNEHGSTHRIWLDHLMNGEFLLVKDHLHEVRLEVKHNYDHSDAVLCEVIDQK